MIRALSWGLWYHQGSIAVGSFLIAVIAMIRVVFEFVAAQYEMANKENPIVKIVSCCVRCVLYLLDAYVKFMTKNAFIQIALKSGNFCSSAANAFYMLIRHAGRFSSSVLIGWIMMILGKGAIMALSGYLTILLITVKYPLVKQPFIPAILLSLFGYMVGSLFLSVFSFSATAILHCFILDEDTGGARFRPDSLKSFVDENDKAVDDKTSKDKKSTPVD